MTTPLDLPIVCQLTDAQLSTRRQHVLEKLTPKIQQKKALADGYAFAFSADDDVAQELLSFVLLERQCCSFFQIELVFSAGQGPIWLQLRGNDGAKQFIETELDVMLA